MIRPDSQRNDQLGQLLRRSGRALNALELSLPLSNSADALAVLIDHHFAIFLGKGLVQVPANATAVPSKVLPI